MSERLTDEELARLSTPGPITKIEYPDGKGDVLHIVTVRHSDLAALLTELRERRALDLSDEEREALRWLRGWPQWDMKAFTDRHPMARRTIEVLDRLLSQGGHR